MTPATSRRTVPFVGDEVESPAGEGQRTERGTWPWGPAAIGSVGAGGVVAVLVTFVLVSSLSLGSCEFDYGPGKGTDSERLAVDVAPRTGLTDGATVRVTSRAFTAQSIVGLAVCLRAADTEQQGVDACDTVAGSRVAVPPDGRLDAAFVVPRVVTVGGTAHDCAAAPCLVVAADANDFDRSGGEEIRFAEDLPPADLTPRRERGRTDLLPITADPPGPVPAGATLSVTATGLVPGEPVLVGLCTEDFLRLDPWEACTTDDTSAALTAILGRDVVGIDDRADADGSFTTEVAITRSVTPFVGVSGRQPTAAACTAAPGRCAVVIAAAADTKRSAYLPVTVTD